MRKIDDTYNGNYLRSEYNFVQASADMAARWESFSDDDRYELQYRTAGDDRVRPEHAALDGITLSKSDSFWNGCMPPNSWNCRCQVVQVRRGKYPTTPHSDAMPRGDKALAKDTKGMFRFNSGKQAKSVPDYNPYTIKRCNSCDVAKGKAKLAFVPSNNLCEGCIIVHKCYNNKAKSEASAIRTHYLEKMKPLLSKTIEVNGNGHKMNVGFRKEGNKHLYKDASQKYATLHKEDLKDVDKLLAKATFIKKTGLFKPRKDDLKRFYYYEAELHGNKVYLSVAEKGFVLPSGKIRHYRFLYSIKDRIK